MDWTAEVSGSNNVTPVAKGISPIFCIGSDLKNKAVKTANVVEERDNVCDCQSRVCWCDSIRRKRQKFIPRLGSAPDIFNCDNWIEGLDLNKYGSVTEDIEALIAYKKSYMVSNQETTPSNAGNLLNVEKSPSREDLRTEHAALPDIIVLEDDGEPSSAAQCFPAEEFGLSANCPVIIDLEDENLGSENILPPLQEINIRKSASDILTKAFVDLGCAQDQWFRKENYFSEEAEIKKEQVVDLVVGAEEKMADIHRQTDANSESLTKNSEVNQDSGVNLVVEAENGMEEGNGAADANNECLAKIPETNTDKCVNLGIEARDEMVERNGQTATNCEGPANISEFNKDKGRYVVFEEVEKVEEENEKLNSGSDMLPEISFGMEDDEEVEEDNGQLEAGCDDLANIWNEMEFALEYSKDTAVDSLNEECAIEDVEGCDHSFILKEDIGYVCRICGFIQKAIETIIEFQYAKAKRRGKTYRHEGSLGKDWGQTKILPEGVKLADHDYSTSELTVHPRHRKVMKPHQVEGFNFLLSNLLTDNPGGCIMAHAPGSGKTFMMISFLQSFMAKYPSARPLIVLPRGILSTWKKEFQIWQVEDIPLYDFYSSKADSRSQQLEILNHWANERSILFLGYKQFSSIVCDSDTSKIASACEEILLTCPSILILDEGHTPRNQNTDILKSLEKVQTPRKVVLSGTLYQNHVEEVFNILNLVRPRFLKLDASKMIKRRILSRVQILGRKSSLKKFSNDDFYDAVEHTLLKDESFNRKVTVIQDLREMTSKVLHYYKGDSLDELPGLVDFTIFLELSPRQKGEITELKKMKNRFKRNSDGSNIYVHPLLKTLSMNCGVKERVDDHKIDLILEKLNESEGVKAKFYLNLLRLCESSGEKLLVFSQYLLPLKFLERLTVKVMGYSLGKETFMITGDSDSDIRDAYMEQFNNSSAARVFFGSIKACGEGISLVGASRIMILDVHLNPSVTRQAIGRAFRPGQVRKVYTYRLVASDSPEIDDHLTCFRKETISKLWFEWNGCLGERDFEMDTVSIEDAGDLFLETQRLNEDIVSVFKR